MKVCGFTIVRNAIKFCYPVVESIKSILPLCDRMVVAVGNSDDDSLSLIQSIGNEKISIVICDHPKNQSYPTYWHAREYGLFAANPLGASNFTQGKTVLNFKILPGKSTTFRYRVIINSGRDLTDSEINTYSDEFAKEYKWKCFQMNK